MSHLFLVVISVHCSKVDHYFLYSLIVSFDIGTGSAGFATLIHSPFDNCFKFDIPLFELCLLKLSLPTRSKVVGPAQLILSGMLVLCLSFD